MNAHKGDCCGLCRCKEDTAWCCCGHLLSPKLQKFSGIYKAPKSNRPENPYIDTNLVSGFKDQKMLSAMGGSGKGSGVGGSSLRRQSTRNMSTRGFITDDEYSSAVERFLATQYAPELTTFQGRITVLAIWACAVVVAAYGCTNIEVNFKFEYFIPPDSVPDLYFTLDRKYFNGGAASTVYIENDDPIIDYSLPENQYALLDFHDKL
jgi:hypothetical protein